MEQVYLKLMCRDNNIQYNVILVKYIKHFGVQNMLIKEAYGSQCNILI